MSKLVAIHQPNFFPWLGYFDKIRRADVFVVLDAVDYPRSGSGGMGSWTNRVRIDVQGTARWITCPVRRLPLGTPIREATIDDTQDWRSRFRKTLASCYGRGPGYPEAIDLLGSLIDCPETSLAVFNMQAIEVIARRLGLETPLVPQSALPHDGKGTELLISLVKAAGGDAYLAGGGASGYQRDPLFAEHGVELVYQGFEPKPYTDFERFIPGLSVIDYLMRTPSAQWRTRWLACSC